MLRAPEPLASAHDIGGFDSGVRSLDDWLRRRALQNQASGASRTFVICDGSPVVAHYALAAGAVAPDTSPGRFRRNMPDPIPVAVLARLAVALDRPGQGLSRAMVQDAARRVIHAADSLGIRGLLIHAISDEAKAFYVRLGFAPSPLDPMTLMASLTELKASLA